MISLMEKDMSDIGASTNFSNADFRGVYNQLLSAGMSERQANIHIDAFIELADRLCATKAEVKEVDHRVDKLELKIDALIQRFDDLKEELKIMIADSRKTTVIWVGTIMIACTISICGVLYKFLPTITKLLEVSNR
jgi:hypothetical protein